MNMTSYGHGSFPLKTLLTSETVVRIEKKKLGINGRKVTTYNRSRSLQHFFAFRVHTVKLSAHYLLKQLVNFDQTCIDTCVSDWILVALTAY